MVSVRVLKMQGVRYYTAANKIVTLTRLTRTKTFSTVDGASTGTTAGGSSITIEVEDCLNYNIGHSFEHDMYGVTIKAEELTDSFR
jgi:hypothetical protein